MPSPIGIFDSGYGGLTVFRAIAQKLPQYDYCYLGDNARAPYGTRSFETVYRYTLECVEWFFKQGCPLVILACNTASARALRSIQQNDLPTLAPDRRVLGIIRPTAEVIGQYTRTRKVGVLGTNGTISSGSYDVEISQHSPGVDVFSEACPMWVPLVESGEHTSVGADYFVQKHVESLLQKSTDIDTVLLGCTHYPLLEQKISKYLPEGVTLLSQGGIVATSLEDYLQRHPEIETRLSKSGSQCFYTTDAPADFDAQAGVFFGGEIKSCYVEL
jgi:glutamate racemase